MVATLMAGGGAVMATSGIVSIVSAAAMAICRTVSIVSAAAMAICRTLMTLCVIMMTLGGTGALMMVGGAVMTAVCFRVRIAFVCGSMRFVDRAAAIIYWSYHRVYSLARLGRRLLDVLN